MSIQAAQVKPRRPRKVSKTKTIETPRINLHCVKCDMNFTPKHPDGMDFARKAIKTHEKHCKGKCSWQKTQDSETDIKVDTTIGDLILLGHTVHTSWKLVTQKPKRKSKVTKQ